MYSIYPDDRNAKSDWYAGVFDGRPDYSMRIQEYDVSLRAVSGLPF